MDLHLVLGRLIGPQDDGPNAAGVFVLTYRFWATTFKKDPSIIGKTVRLGGLGSDHDCMEVIAARGGARDVREPANALLSMKGVKPGKPFLTLPTREVATRKKAAHSHAHNKNKPARRVK